MKRRGLATVVLALAGVAACGGDDDTSSPTSASSPPSATAAVTTVAAGSGGLAELATSFCIAETPTLQPPAGFEEGPGPDDTRPKLNSGDPALEIRGLAVVDGGCAPDESTVILAELGGPPDLVYLHVAVDADPTRGRAGIALAPTGLERVGGWEQRIITEPGLAEVRYQDDKLAAIEPPARVECSGNVCAFAVPRIDNASGDVTYYVQVMRRDVPIGPAPRDWTLATLVA